MRKLNLAIVLSLGMLAASPAFADYTWDGPYSIGDNGPPAVTWKESFYLDCSLHQNLYQVTLVLYTSGVQYKNVVTLNGQEVAFLEYDQPNWNLDTIAIPPSFFRVGENEIAIKSAVDSTGNHDDFEIRNISINGIICQDENSCSNLFEEGKQAGIAACKANPAFCGIGADDGVHATYEPNTGELYVPFVDVPGIFGGTQTYEIYLIQQIPTFLFDLDMNRVTQK